MAKKTVYTSGDPVSLVDGKVGIVARSDERRTFVMIAGVEQQYLTVDTFVRERTPGEILAGI